MKTATIFFLIYILTVFFPTSAFPQGAAEAQKQRLAETYENTGDITNAARIWEELYSANPSSDKNFGGVVRTFKALNRFSDLMPYVTQRLEQRRTHDILSLYGELLWRLGKTNEAQTSWDNAIKEKPDSPESYNLVATTQVSLRLFDKATVTLENGRAKLKMANLFGEQLCNLYIAAGDYQKGFNEILSQLSLNSNLPLAQGRLYALLGGEEASLYLQARLKSEADAKQSNLLIQQLYAWFLRTTNKLDDALNVYKRIDALYNANGREVLTFADLSRTDGHLDIAIRGYEDIIERGKSNPYISAALYGYARTLELKGLSGKQMSKVDAKRIVNLYESVISDFPSSHTAHESKYRIAMIAFEYLQDEERAIEELKSLLHGGIQPQLSATASLLIGSIYVSLGKTDEGRRQFEQTLANYTHSMPEIGEKALYKLAELEYYLGNIEKATEYFYQIAENKNSSVAAEAINKIVLIEQNKEFDNGLKLFAQAELRQKQKKISEAAELFLKAAEVADGSGLSELALLNAAQISFSLNELANALKLYRTIIEKNPESIYSDLVNLSMGNIYLVEKNKEEALKHYTLILTKYPRSIYLNEARQKIREIRSETM